MRVFFVALIFILVGINISHAQTRYEKYDSIFYERIFSPTFSTMMMPKGYVEVILNNSLLSTNKFWNDDSQRQDYDSRFTYNYSLIQTNFGVSTSSRVSLGLDFYYVFARRDADRGSSSFNVFTPNAKGNIQSANGLTGLAPRLKVVPFKRYKNFIFQTSLFFPTISDQSVKTFLGADQTVLRNQFLYSIRISDKFMSFAQGDVDVYFKKGSNAANSYGIPVNLYLYWIATKHIFPYASIGYGTKYQKIGDSFKSGSNYIPAMVGLQYQFSLRFNINASYSKYLSARNNGDWNSFNIGLRGVF